MQPQQAINKMETNRKSNTNKLPQVQNQGQQWGLREHGRGKEATLHIQPFSQLLKLPHISASDFFPSIFSRGLAPKQKLHEAELLFASPFLSGAAQASYKRAVKKSPDRVNEAKHQINQRRDTPRPRTTTGTGFKHVDLSVIFVT